MDVARHVTDDERRARLGRRQLLADGTAPASVADVAAALSGLHATDNSTVYLSLWARIAGVEVADIDRALYTERTIVKQMAMRRTIFAFPRPLLPAALRCAQARISAPHRRLIARDVKAAGIAPDGAAWLERAADAACATLAATPALSAPELGTLPELAGRIERSVGTSWAASAPIAPRVLTQLWIDGVITRAANAAPWWLSKPRWALTTEWLGGPIDPVDADTAFATLVRSWLHTFGPGTVDDIVWWLGATKTIVRAALTAVGAVPVSLDQPVGTGSTRPSADATIGWLLPDDLDVVESPAPWAALLPTLDPTTMGWKHRRFYVGEQQPLLFDLVGNGGATAWWDGRIVGVWVQDAAGRVHVAPTSELDAVAGRAFDTEAERLTAWLGGQRVGTTYTSAAMLAARAALA